MIFLIFPDVHRVVKSTRIISLVLFQPFCFLSRGSRYGLSLDLLWAPREQFKIRLRSQQSLTLFQCSSSAKIWIPTSRHMDWSQVDTLFTENIGLFILPLLRIILIRLFYHDLACFGLSTSSLFHPAPSAVEVLLPLGRWPCVAPSPKESIAQCLTLLFLFKWHHY